MIEGPIEKLQQAVHAIEFDLQLAPGMLMSADWPFRTQVRRARPAHATDDELAGLIPGERG
jgi:hypothetical protein